MSSTSDYLMLDAEIRGEMNHYIEEGKKLINLNYIHVKSDDSQLHVEVRTHEYISNDEYSYWVTFDSDGNYLSGISWFHITETNSKEEVNQTFFKEKINKEVDLVNKMHMSIKELIDYRSK